MCQLQDPIFDKTSANKVKDPTRKKRKGRQVSKKQKASPTQKCSYYKMIGHNTMTCLTLKNGISTSTHEFNSTNLGNEMSYLGND